QQKTFSGNLESIRKQINTEIKQIRVQEKLVEKAEIILNLEKRISNYETDRQNLKKGEPCGLCGSKTHPFVDYLASYNVSESEIELEKTKKNLQLVVHSKNELDKNEVQLNTTINGLTELINSISEEIKGFKVAVNQLNIDCELTNESKINLELNVATEQIKSINKCLKDAQQLQIRKNEVSESIKIQNNSVSMLKMTVATLREKNKNSKTEIETKQVSISKLTKICTDLEQDLQIKLSKFNYEIPAIERTNLFIQEMKELIANFDKKQKNLELLKSDFKVINTNIANTKKQLETHSKTRNEYYKTIDKCNTTSTKLKAERIGILPIIISVESKRESLQSVRNDLAKKVESSKKELQKQLDFKTEKEALKVTYTKEQNRLIDELNGLKTTLNFKIKNTHFESKEAIEKALLSEENKVKYTKNKEQIKEQQLKVKALQEANIKAKEELNTAKKFTISEAESKLALEGLKTKSKLFLSDKGAIFERFRKNQEIRDRNQEIYKKMDTQTAICNVWKELFKIIGNSKDAFNVYVQRLTLKQLLNLANVHLYNLNKRYSLKMEADYKPKEELNFNLIDHYQTDQARLVDTSSGGEKFIISLALALGLSDLASKNVKIDSLFIDEGFGTLDGNTLETVISTLETLQSQGKMIGIISHVENLKERISTQIQITKKSNGVSTVNIL
ncbi:MAG: SbcC/MukB-like Walker B domain-containing protein, partial [Polaribacter sp.]